MKKPNHVLSQTLIQLFTLPELQALSTSLIEGYQGSPVKNQNKLNEVIARAVGFNNFDALSPQLGEHVDQQEKLTDLLSSLVVPDVESIVAYKVDHFQGDVYIDGVNINDDVFDECMVNYGLSSREDRINDLYTWIYEGRSPLVGDGVIDTSDMEADLDYLRSLDDEYVFDNISTNEFVAASDDTKRFNEICEAVLEAHNALEDGDKHQRMEK